VLFLEELASNLMKEQQIFMHFVLKGFRQKFPLKKVFKITSCLILFALVLMIELLKENMSFRRGIDVKKMTI